MLLTLFESRYRRERDAAEIRDLVYRFGDRAKDVVRERAATAAKLRDRNHWRRIARKL